MLDPQLFKLAENVHAGGLRQASGPSTHPCGPLPLSPAAICTLAQASLQLKVLLKHWRHQSLLILFNSLAELYQHLT